MTTEIITDNPDTTIVDVDDILDLKIGDKFYFSREGTTPRSEDEYCTLHPEFKEKFIGEIISSINKKAKAYHIKHYEVVNVSNSLSKSYLLSIDNPETEFVRSITVVEI